eukprot:TRINITY_DN12654_c0_g1_i3.p1 TRINITY_DN12654_c0_g1~~TRINITY_DN12654_c0_g1_i3.p1  ORF type:complete len:743 (-),score=84.26 TRINITY_DN12654_c0_g1_i3:124-2352(-)
MHLSPLWDSYYASNYTYDYYFLVLPSTPSLRLTVQSQASHYLCNAVLLCGGHGVCPQERNEDKCTCIAGLDFGYSGRYCDDFVTPYPWLMPVIFVVVGLVIIGVIARSCIIGLTAMCFKRRGGQSHDSTTTSSSYSSQQHHTPTENSRLLSGVDSLGSDTLSTYLDRADISLQRVGLTVGKGTVLLTDINMTLKSGTFTAIFGPSGAGKSTVMKVLSGRVTPTEGTVAVNGHPIHNFKPYRSLIGYVPQEDVLNPFLSVRENILHSALIRLPSGLPRSQKDRLVDVVIDALGLRHRQHMLVGDIGGRSALSGGQRKRVSIAIELVTCPSILFLDEPTSGLDSKSALSLITILKEQVASLGINVIAVLHQPRYEILNLCDNIAILADGRLRYFGSPNLNDLARDFPPLQRIVATGVNIADMLIDQIEEFQWSYNEASTSSSVNDVTSLPQLRPRRIASFVVQLYYLTKRALLQILRDHYSLAVLYGLTVFSAILIGVLYLNARFIGPPSEEVIAKCPAGFQFLCAQNQEDTYMVQGLLMSLSLGLTIGSASLGTFGGSEKLLFTREKTSGQNNFAYLIAKFLSSLPNHLLAPLVFMLIFEYLTAPFVPFWKLYLTALGISEVCMGIAHFLSLVSADNRALIVTVVVICVCNILSGFNPTLHQLRNALGPVLGRLLPALSYSRWSIESLYVAVLTSFSSIYDVTIALSMWGYALREQALALAMPFVLGATLRLACAIAIAVIAR